MNQVLPEWGFIFSLGFRHHFFGHTGFRRFKISKKKFFLNSDFRHHRKMYRLGTYIPIFRCFFFYLKYKKNVYM